MNEKIEIQKELPMLMKGEMVIATLKDNKTNTRRLNGLKEINEEPDMWSLLDLSLDPELGWDEDNLKVMKGFIGTFENVEYGGFINIRSPYSPGDLVYIRETWKVIGRPYIPANVVYRADHIIDKHNGAKWKPSIFMPKKFARLWVKVKEVRLERLQDISEEDAINEGLKTLTLGGVTGYLHYDLKHWLLHPTDSFKTLWDSINKNRKDKEGKPLNYGWDFNPWVWVIVFERIKK